MATYIWRQNPEVEKVLTYRTVQSSIPHLLPILDRLPDEIVVLDVGCGPGGITCDLAKQYPSATVLGIDYNPQMVEMARQCARDAGLSNVRFAVGDALNLAAVAAAQPGFEALLGGCDVVYTHQMFLHVQDAQALMRELHGAARPHGGQVCCLEAYPTIRAQHPPTPAMDVAWDALLALMQVGGQDIHAARRMGAYAQQAGFRAEDVDFSPVDLEFKTRVERENMADLVFRSFKNPATAEMARGLISAQDLQTALKAADAWVQREDGCIRVRCFQIACTRRE